MSVALRLGRPAIYTLLAAVAAVITYTVLTTVTGTIANTISLKPDDQSIRTHGRQLYAKYCASCHGVKLEGQPNWKTPLSSGRLPAPPHDETGHTWHHTDELLFRLTKYGPAEVSGRGHQSDMPSFQDLLSDSDIVAVLSYIKSTWPRLVRIRHNRLNEIAKAKRNKS